MKTLVVGAACVMMASAAVAQQLPSAGGQLQQIPPGTEPPRAVPRVTVERPTPPPPVAAAGPGIAVASLGITGATLSSESELIAASGFRAGSVMTLADLQLLASRIADFYNARGYFVAQAYLPPQPVDGGRVVIAVVEGHYGKVTPHNTSRASDRTVRGVLAGLAPGDLVANKPLERRLLLLGDLPGVGVHSTLAPGTAIGSSDLGIDVTPTHRISGDVEGDNAGNRYTGYFRAGGTVNLNEPFGLGDVISLRGLVSDGGLTYVRGSYQATAGVATIGVAYARLDYRLHREFESLRAHGSADIVSVYGSYPLIRSYNANLNALGGVDFKFFHDQADAVGSTSSKQSQVGTIGLSGDSRDSFGGGGASFYSIGGTYGNLDIRTPVVLAADAATTRSNGGFGRFNAAIGRVQALSGPLSLYVAVRGQVATKNLDISEKMELGGAYAVRAYPEGEAYGDDGYVATAELRLTLAALARRVPGEVQLFGFIDNGGITFNHDRFATGRNHANLTGGGAGVSWARNGDFLVKASYAHRIGSDIVTSEPDHAGRFWVQLVKSF
ncbi:ShlB/FhaC/HecB family hemolysin secretion/activation protein [Polymorphobacter sp. PAMC 29334]|uniref:ShlB/FhaC/HecB family hemolysin secretion/activation protein n=1 Tax=Polymorphobacter sp. PAMC 29334 TaxID=2862331 RepID=UPI001D0252AD|nr:ShlB/FhaC/HecB family hemolysin secretion/activation protein [Polymorphobacter sp. PAMC 29334]